VTEEYKRKPNTVCFVCNKQIYKRPSQIKQNKKHVFCSMNCFGISCRKEIPCLVCGKMILSGLNKKTCSRSCSNINRTGVKYHLGSPRDKVKSQKALKLKLLKARGGFCERCGYSKIKILQVHHKNRDRKNNDLENLELVCPNCHYEEHHLEKKHF